MKVRFFQILVAVAYRDLEQASARLQLIERIAALFTETPAELLPTVALLCQGQIAPDFACFHSKSLQRSVRPTRALDLPARGATQGIRGGSPSPRPTRR